MSDNGTCFTGRFFSGGEAPFERDLRHWVCAIPFHAGNPANLRQDERFARR